MKKIILIVTLLLIVISGVNIFSEYFVPLQPSDVIIKVDKNAFLKTSEKQVVNIFQNNREGFQKLAEYVLANYLLICSKPILLSGDISGLFDSISDAAIRDIALDISKNGIFKEASSLTDGFVDAKFTVASESERFEQGIRYVNDPQIIAKEKSEYNYIKENRDLGGGWFYYLYYYNEIKDADIYKKIVWEQMGEMDRKANDYDWNRGIVTLVDWDSVFYKMDKADREFVVSVYFRTDNALLGPLTVYLDPVTKKVVGTVLRM